MIAFLGACARLVMPKRAEEQSLLDRGRYGFRKKGSIRWESPASIAGSGASGHLAGGGESVVVQNEVAVCRSDGG